MDHFELQKFLKTVPILKPTTLWPYILGATFLGGIVGYTIALRYSVIVIVPYRKPETSN